RSQRRKQYDAAAFAQHRQKLLDEKVGRTHVDGKEVVKVFDGRLFDARGSGNARVRNQHVEPSTDDGAHASGELVRTIGGAQIGGDFLRVAAARSDVGDDGIRSCFVAAVVHEHLRAGAAECKRDGAADAAGCARDKRGFSCEVIHGKSSV